MYEDPRLLLAYDYITFLEVTGVDDIWVQDLYKKHIVLMQLELSR
jgi:hypothetical protein